MWAFFLAVSMAEPTTVTLVGPVMVTLGEQQARTTRHGQALSLAWADGEQDLRISLGPDWPAAYEGTIVLEEPIWVSLEEGVPTLRPQDGVHWEEPRSLVHWAGSQPLLEASVGDQIVELEAADEVYGLHFHDLASGWMDFHVRDTAGEIRGELLVPAGAEVWVRTAEDGKPRAVRVKLYRSAKNDRPDWHWVGDMLTGRCAIDQQLRSENRETASTDEENTTYLKELVEGLGRWPTADELTADQLACTWLLVQHSPDLAFQQSSLPLLEGLVEASSLALLQDRILVREGKPQRYGTQFQTREGVMRPLPMEPGVDEPREEIGLDPMKLYARQLGELYGRKASPTPWEDLGVLEVQGGGDEALDEAGAR